MCEDERPNTTWRAALLETQAIYRRADEAYAAYACPATSECCQLIKRGRQPWLWPSEWRLLYEAALKSWDELPTPREDGGCPFLDARGERCRAYEHRPFGCRTFFCHRATGPSSQPLQKVIELSRRLEAVNQRLDPDIQGPSELLTLMAAARMQPEQE